MLKKTSTYHIKCGEKKPVPIMGTERLKRIFAKYVPPRLKGVIEYGEWVDRTVECRYELTTTASCSDIKVLDLLTGETVSVPRRVFCNRLVNPNGLPLFEALKMEFETRPLVLPLPRIGIS